MSISNMNKETPMEKVKFLIHCIRENEKAGRIPDDEFNGVFHENVSDDRFKAVSLKQGSVEDLPLFEINGIAEKHTDIHPDVEIRPSFFTIEDYRFFDQRVSSGRVITAFDSIGRPLYEYYPLDNIRKPLETVMN